MIRTQSAPVCAAIVTVLFVAFECAQWMLLREARDSAHWPTAQGTVVNASQGRVSVRRRLRPTPQIEYTYEVDGATYTGSRYTAYRVGMSEEEVESILAAAPVGGPVPVYYNPADPDVSMLSPGAEHWAPLVWILRVVLALMTLMGWYWVYRGGFPDRKGR